MSSDQQIFTGKFCADAADFQQQCSEILEKFQDSSDVLRASRNTLKNVVFGGKTCVVKAFKKPSFPQNYSYGLFSDSKAKKSYNNAHTLIEKGFSTPAPIGYFERREAGKLTVSYYICEYAESTETLKAIFDEENQFSESLIEQFAKFCVSLHDAGVFHRDFNPLNILVSETDSKHDFSMVDINRITWYQSLTLEKAMYSLSRLGFPEEVSGAIIDQYAEHKDVSSSLCLQLFNKSVRKTERYFANKKKLRKIFPKKK